MDYYQLTHDGNSNDSSVWYKLCNCCPYGYHIDLDFVHYCNTLELVNNTASMKRRKDRRRQRRSMVVLLGLDSLSGDQISSEGRDMHCLELVQEYFPFNRSDVINDDLHKAVLDFEQALLNSKMTESHSRASDIYGTLQCSLSPVSVTTDSLKMIMSASTSKSGESMEQPCGIVSADLQNIREQMALSLERTRIVEDLVKHIPLLQAQLAELKEEKRELLLQINANKDKNYILNGQIASHLNLATPVQKPITSHKKDVGLTCSLLLPLRDSETQYIKTSEWKPDEYADKWFKHKSKFLNENCVKNSVCNSLVTCKRSDILLVTKETQTTLPRNKKDASIQAINNNEVQSIDNSQDFGKLFRSVGISASIHKSDSSTEPIRTSASTVGISDDTIDAILCIKCAYRNIADKYTSTFLDGSSIELQNRTVGCQYYMMNNDISIQCNINTLKDNTKKNKDVATNIRLEAIAKKETHSVSSQHEYFGLHKTSQVDLKLKDKAVQYDIPIEVTADEFCLKCNAKRNEIATSVGISLNKQPPKISLSSLTMSRSKSFCSFDAGFRTGNVHKATQTLLEVEDRSIQCDDVTYFTKFKTKLAQNGTFYESEMPVEIFSYKNAESTFKDDLVVAPSRIPRLQLSTEIRKLKRQDTYNIDLSKTTSFLPENNIEHDFQAATAVVSQNVENDSNLSPSTLSSSMPLYSETHLDTHSERKKALPSTSMKAALKVLSDCLKKGQTENLEDQLKNSINIVQLDWFKISSLIDANPLDVEDYLDFFEDISFNLLHYIVNMVDANGNTAIHYAVSHGNFDVVSILLDSKVCDVNQANKVGYTSVMLVSLAEISSLEHANVVRRLFKLADVNIKAKQHGQTALMLAVSHGRLDMVQMLLHAGADINIQDEDGSTALMCAAEHGHIQIIKLFLEQPECDSTLADVDGSTALTIAMEAGHRPIGVLLYTHQRIRKSSIHRSKSS